MGPEWEDLLRLLPTPAAMFEGADQDLRARAFLAWFVTQAMAMEGVAEGLGDDPMGCPNCGLLCGDARSPYCGRACREESSFVRQFRRFAASDHAGDVEKQATQGQILWHLLGGGYPRRNAMVPARARERLFARDDGKCQACGAPATTFDHIGSACNRPINLKLMCDDCAETREFGDSRVLDDGAVLIRVGKLGQRVSSLHPLRISDDPDRWDWRQFLDSRHRVAAVTSVDGASA